MQAAEGMGCMAATKSGTSHSLSPMLSRSSAAGGDNGCTSQLRRRPSFTKPGLGAAASAGARCARWTDAILGRNLVEGS